MKSKVKINVRNKFKYQLKVTAGTYYANSLIGILTEVVTHRFKHWVRGEGWND